MQPHFKKYILENADTKSVQEIAAHLNLSEKSVADFLKKEKVRSPGGRGGNTPADALSKNPASAAQPAAAPQRRRDLSSDPRGGGPAPAPGFDFRQTLLFLAVSAVLAWLIYHPALSSGFTFDDQETILDNAAILRFDPLAIWNAFNSRFVVGLTLALNHAAGGFDAAGYHLFNTAAHVAAAVFVFLLAREAFETPAMRRHAAAASKDVVAWGAGLLFLAHPVQTQPVNYVWQRSAVLAALFYAAALFFYSRWRRTGGRGAVAASLVSSLLAMFSKETSVTLPAAVVLYELCFFAEGGIAWNAVFRRTGLFLALFPVIPLTWTRASSLTLDMMRPDTMKGAGATGLDLGRFVSEKVMTRQDYILTQFNVVRTYLRLLVAPVRQNLDYDYPIARGVNPEVVVSFLLLAGLVWAAVWLLKRNRLLSFGVFLFFLGLSVESFVVQNDVIFEHRLYLPMIGACLFLSGGAVWLLRRRAAAAAVLGVCVIALGAAAHARNEIWSNELVLWEDVVQKSPGKARPHLNLAVAYHEKGQTEKAIEHFRRALEIQPDRALTYYNLAASQKKAGRADEAIQSYEKAIELKPDFAEAYNNLAILRAARGDFQEATDLLERAVQLKPNYEDARVNLAKLSARRG